MQEQSFSVEYAFSILSRIENLNHENAKIFWQLIQKLTELKESKAYKTFNVNSWSEFINSYTNYSVSYVETLIKIGKKFGFILQNIDEIPPISRLKESLPYIKTEEDAQEWFIKALTLPYRGWIDELREAKGKIPQDQCKHEIKELWFRCKTCGKWIKKVENEEINNDD